MEYLIGACIVLIAVLYSSIGHGGASGYLAVMALFSVVTIYMKPTALTLNLFVAGISFIMYYRAGYFYWRKLYPFIITSIPFAFLGGSTEINPEIYKIILGGFLLIATVRMFFIPSEKLNGSKDVPIEYGIIIGAVLGYVSGLIGIGGGIILAPILILAKWANLKEAAAVSALFIFLNSASGLVGHLLNGSQLSPSVVIWIFAGIIGGLLGGYLGSNRFKLPHLRIILGLVLILASIKLFLF